MKYVGVDVLHIMKLAKNYNKYLAEFCMSKLNKDSKCVLDFGAGLGTISDILNQHGYNIQCVECDEDLAEDLKQKGYKVSSSLDKIDNDTLDNIVSFNVLEHISDDFGIMKQINQKLKKDGIFFCFVPAYQYLFSNFDKSMGHFRRYDMDKIIKLAEDSGFIVKESFYFDSLGFICANIYKLINKNGKVSKLSIKVFDNFILPFSIMLDKFCHKKFGKNIALVLTKN